MNLTAEQTEQRQTLIDMGYLPGMVDTQFAPSEWAMLIQESLVDDLIGDDEDE